MPFTPITGLSLAIHLTIIGTAYVLRLAGKKFSSQLVGSAIQGNLAPVSMLNKGFSAIVAVFVLTCSIFFMGVFGLTAFTTALREGAHEPHIKFVKAWAADLYTSDSAFAQIAHAQTYSVKVVSVRANEFQEKYVVPLFTPDTELKVY